MKRKVDLILILLTGALLMLISGCTKNETGFLATVETSTVTNITGSSATCGGNILNTGNGEIIDRGICWSMNPNPTVSDSKVSNGAGAGSFTSSITGLFPSTIYYVRAYATNSDGTGYGNQISFTTLFSDQSFYMEIGVTLIQCYTDIYNQNLAGKPTGAQNITANGPMGGTVVITGTDSWDNTHSIMTTDLLFSMTNVKYTYTYTGSNNKSWVTEITLNGTATHKGSWSDSYTSISHISDNLHIKGSVTYDGSIRTIDMTGSVAINRATKTTVNIFGNTVSW